MNFVRPSALRLFCRQQTGHVWHTRLVPASKVHFSFLLAVPQLPSEEGSSLSTVSMSCTTDGRHAWYMMTATC